MLSANPSNDHQPATDLARQSLPSAAATGHALPGGAVPAADEATQRPAENIAAAPDQAGTGGTHPGRLVLFALLIFAVLLALATATFKQARVLPGEVKSQLAEMETIKQDLVRVRQQAEAMQHERDAALTTARQAQEQREQERQQALATVQREQEAAAAAALAAEKALQASRQAEERANQQRLEEVRLRAERRRLQQEKKEAELVQQRLLEQRRQAELEKKRLEREQARAEALPQQQAAADQQKQPAAGADDAAGSVAGTVADQELRKKEASFNTDPCSSPSAKFLSTCR